MRYDYWPNMIWAMKNFEVPSFIVDATMKSHSSRKLLFSKNFHKVLFRDITKILTVSEKDSDGFKVFGCTDDQLEVVGDTRFDRVYQKSLTAKEKNLIKYDIIKNKKVFVAGSTWEVDEDIILPSFITIAKYDKDIIFIIAPHEPTLLHLEKIENEFSGKLKTIRFSFLNNYKDERVIIIDWIEDLLTLYTYADAALSAEVLNKGFTMFLKPLFTVFPLCSVPELELPRKHNNF